MIPLTKDSMNQAMHLVQNFEANMGDTLIYPALKACYDCLLDKGGNETAQQIFVLTDGAVMNIREIVELAGLQKHLAEVHTFGLGECSSPGLIIELAEITGGTYNFVLEHDNTLNSKIVASIQQASRPNLIRSKVSMALFDDS